ncbi:MAG: hypothetical protein ABEJ76_03445 [Halanaeroarchaeum sp.]
MARPNVGVFTSYLTAAGIGLLLAGALFGADLCAFGGTCRADIWDFFYAMGIMLVVLGAPISLLSTLGRYLHG